MAHSDIPARYAKALGCLVLLSAGCEPFTGGPTGSGGSHTTSTGMPSTNSATSTSSAQDCSVAGCPNGDHAMGVCEQSVCKYTCADHFADCNSSPDSCEADLSADGNCGGCGVNCAKECKPFGSTYGCTEIVELALGAKHSCARSGDGVVWCWGDNAVGQLGDGGGESNSATPLKVALQFPAVHIAAGGDGTCAISQAGELACWGRDGTPTSKPLKYATKLHLVEVAVGGNDGTTSTALLDSNEARKFTQSNVADNEPASLKAAQTGITSGLKHGCIFDASHQVSCFGDDSLGQLGQGSTGHLPILTVVPDANAKKIAAGDNHTCVIDDGGLVSCWGANESHQVVNGGTPQAYKGVDGVTGAQMIACGGSTSAAIAGASLFLWGANDKNQASPSGASTIDSATAYSGLAKAPVFVAVGGKHVCVIEDAGAIECWGDNSSGQVGTMASATPVKTPHAVQLP